MNSYPSIYNLGHKAVVDLLRGPVLVEEKIDGSQFSFGVVPNDDPEFPLDPLHVRSKGALLSLLAPEKMFSVAVETAKRLQPLLHPGWTYRCEYLRSPRHNTLCYNRVPLQNLIVFDINDGHESYLSYDDKAAEAARLGLEVVPLLHQGVVPDVEFFRELLNRESVLGGQPIEGVVVKPVGYDLFGRDKKALFGKFVSEAFKEHHSKAWSESNPSASDIVETLTRAYGTSARWAKAVQHLREAGQIEDSPRDIGKLLPEVVADVLKECEDEIKEKVWHWVWPKVSRGLTRGLPQWYKEELLKRQFGVSAPPSALSPGETP